MTWYPQSFTKVPMTDMSMRPDHSRGYPGRTYRFYTGNQVYGFGHGLSYTDFTYSFLSAPEKLSLSELLSGTSSTRILSQIGEKPGYIKVDEIISCDRLRFRVKISVMNVGDMDGSHVVMLFSRVPKAIPGTPEKQLIGFDRVHTIAHGSTETSILVNPCDHLSIADEQGKRIMLLGDHVLLLGELEHVIAVEA